MSIDTDNLIPATTEGKIALCEQIALSARTGGDVAELVALLALMMADDYRDQASAI